ncbi:MAG: hypothetical protein ACRD3Q_08570 [Terriglobales bacterium]
MRQVTSAFVLLLALTASASPSTAVMQSVYFRYIAAPAMRATRSTSCQAIRDRSIPVDRSTDKSTEQSEWAGMELLTEQRDCQYMDAFYAELDYAARNRVLGEGAWQSCLQLAPVHELKTALDLAIYMQCLHVARNVDVCQAAVMNANPYPVTGAGAGCAQLLGANNWSQWGLDAGNAEQRTDSLFVDSNSRAGQLPSGDQSTLQLPTGVTLAGEVRTGFFFNCCLFGMGYNMPYSYLHLPQAVTVSDDFLGTIPVRDIQLDQDVTGSLVDKSVRVACESLRSGETGHYALSVYCDGAKIEPSSPPEGVR